jgi:murein DD-endopeptidase MepM/ murein hydrolase activator NlpD
VRGYGSGEGGYHLAMDIMGEIGWNVRAAAPGIVGYSGDQIKGYGNVVMVIHPGGWVTMYAHNSVNFVVAGEKVPRGGILAEVGSTGISRGPHVHFELIHGGKNCDPAPLFRPGVRHRDGDLAQVDRATWKKSSRRPAEVRCAPRRRHPRSRWVINEDPEKDAAGR